MQRLLLTAAWLMVSPLALAAQGGAAEQEVRDFVAAYDKAVAGRDIAFLERVMPSDYVMTGTSGRKSDRAQVLAFLTRERDKPSYRMVSLKHEQVMVHRVGDMAVITNEYTSQTAPIDAPDAEPDTFHGRHTGVFEKRDGHWMVIAEQDTEQVHDDKLMERQVTSAGRAYHALMQRHWSAPGGDITQLARVLAADYTGTDEAGVVANKAQTLERLKTARISLSSAELSEQKVLAIDNNTALETGIVRYIGMDGGVPFDTTRRFTRTWVSWGEGWQIIAQHSSVVAR